MGSGSVSMHKRGGTYVARVSPVFSAALVMMALIFALGTALPTLAAELNKPEDALFGGHEDDLFGGGNDLLMEIETAPESGSLADEMLLSDGFAIGGTYKVSLAPAWTFPAAGGSASGASAQPKTRLEATSTAYVDVRPSKDWRFFVKGRLDANGELNKLGDIKPAGKLMELFADFHADDRVYFRLGKQTIHWGVGRFFSPADIINIGRIDPENPEADREGPVALKAHMPVGSDNYYMHIIADSVGGETRFAVAPKAEWVIGGTEIGLGTYYRPDRAPRLMMTTSGTVGKVSVFSEIVGSSGSDKRFVEADPTALSGLRVVRKEEQLFAHATIGVMRSWNDPDGRFRVTGAAQYFFNGEGYAPGVLEDIRKHNPLALRALVDAGELSRTDIMVYPSQHYAAVSLNWIEALGSRFSPGLFWLGNLQDGSGMVTASVGVKTWDPLRLSVDVAQTYGGETSEYGMLGNNSIVTLRLGVSERF